MPAIDRVKKLLSTSDFMDESRFPDWKIILKSILITISTQKTKLASVTTSAQNVLSLLMLGESEPNAGVIR